MNSTLNTVRITGVKGDLKATTITAEYTNSDSEQLVLQAPLVLKRLKMSVLVTNPGYVIFDEEIIHTGVEWSVSWYY